MSNDHINTTRLKGKQFYYNLINILDTVKP